MCTACTRAIPHNDVSLEHYICKECDYGWFPKANKSDCMFSLGNCSFTQSQYEIVNQIYECPKCDKGYFWSKEEAKCLSCVSIDGACTACTWYGEECTECINGKVPEVFGKSCVKEFNHCLEHGRNEKNELICFQCNQTDPLNRYFWNPLTKDCTLTTVTNCKIGESLTTCEECNAHNTVGTGFYLEFGGAACKPIPLKTAS